MVVNLSHSRRKASNSTFLRESSRPWIGGANSLRGLPAGVKTLPDTLYDLTGIIEKQEELRLAAEERRSTLEKYKQLLGHE